MPAVPEAVAKRVLIVGLDCAEPSLVLERWRDDLPVLSGLMERGVSGRLRRRRSTHRLADVSR